MLRVYLFNTTSPICIIPTIIDQLVYNLHSQIVQSSHGIDLLLFLGCIIINIHLALVRFDNTTVNISDDGL